MRCSGIIPPYSKNYSNDADSTLNTVAKMSTLAKHTYINTTCTQHIHISRRIIYARIKMYNNNRFSFSVTKRSYSIQIHYIIVGEAGESWITKHFQERFVVLGFNIFLFQLKMAAGARWVITIEDHICKINKIFNIFFKPTAQNLRRDSIVW